MATTTNRQQTKLLPHHTRHFFRARIALILYAVVFMIVVKATTTKPQDFWDICQGCVGLMMSLMMANRDFQTSRQLASGAIKTPSLLYTEEIGPRDDHRRMIWAALGFMATTTVCLISIPNMVLPRMLWIAWIALIPLCNWSCWELVGWVIEMVAAERAYEQSRRMMQALAPPAHSASTPIPMSAAPVKQTLILGKKTYP